MEKPRNLALKILNGQYNNRIFVSDALDDLFRSNTHVIEKDKALISHLVFGTLRWRNRLDWILKQVSNTPFKKIDPPILNILRLAVYQIYYLDRVPDFAAVNEAVYQTKKGKFRHLSPFVNGVLRRICREKDRISFPDKGNNPIKYLSVSHSFPEWLVKKWSNELGNSYTEKLLKALNRIPNLSIRTNLLKTDRKDLINRLQSEGVSADPASFSPAGIILKDLKGPVSELQSFKDGLFLVQGEAAQIVSYLPAPKPGESFFDICSGLGGKTTHVGELTGNKSKVIALDINRSRLLNLYRSAEKLGLQNIHPCVADASRNLLKMFKAGADSILIDAPCSGLGVLSKHPDGKWNRVPEDIKRLAKLQGRILNNASEVLKPGGKMLYVTCTISVEENDEIVDKFLNEHSDFYLQNLDQVAPEWAKELIDDSGFFRSIPHIHDMEGFFAALLLKLS